MLRNIDLGYLCPNKPRRQKWSIALFPSAEFYKMRFGIVLKSFNVTKENPYLLK